ncbi:MAG: LysM peptidoglycan-binding domain-containing protein [Propionibacteriaceae bacterium]|nr:LysM peptidoglycan-binding domain-containing protein [Propionibacteriaceae bacterium]
MPSPSFLRACAAALALGALVCVFPWILLTWGEWSSIAQCIRHPSWLLSHDDGHLVLGILTLVGAVTWVILTCGVGIEVVQAIRNRRGSQPHPSEAPKVLRFSRHLVKPLVSAIFAAGILGGALPSSAEDSHPSPTIESHAWGDGVGVKLHPGEELYQVEPGDSLWSIAERVYGNGQEWMRIAAANEDLLSGGADLIRVGWTFIIPSLNPPSTQVDENRETIIVHHGDSLWSLAQQHLGDGERWKDLAEANPTQVSNPRVIEPGWELVLPRTEQDIDRTANEDSLPPEVSDSDLLDSPSTHGGTEQPPLIGDVVSEEVSEDAHDDLSFDDETSIVSSSTIGISTALAGGVALMITRRRLGQLRSRPVGRRISFPDSELQEYSAALDMVGSQASSNRALSCLDQVFNGYAQENLAPTLSDDNMVTTDYQGGLDSLVLYGDSVAVSLGEDEQGLPVVAEVSGKAPFLVSGDRRRDLTHVLCGIAMNIAVEERLGVLDLHVVSDDDLFSTFEGVTCHSSFTQGLTRLQNDIDTRVSFLGDGDWGLLNQDQAYQEAWRPIIYVFTEPLVHSEYSALRVCLDSVNVGVAVLTAMETKDIHCTGLAAQMSLESHEHATITATNTYVHPHQLEPSAPLKQLLEVSASTETTKAWWSTSDLHEGLISNAAPQEKPAANPALISERRHDTMDSSTMNHEAGIQLKSAFSHPTLKLLGPIQLEGARGTPPLRAERSCLEYCGWLLAHPGTTALAMSQGLMVSEGTRRSNMSRLRSWLGHDTVGKPYLPEAYSGRIWLDAAVTSDWDRMLLLIGHGIEETTTPELMDALALVRGTPLADSTPGQWHWAEEMRTDMVSLIRDIGVVATNRCLETGDIDKARWAASRALMAAPDDEKLLCVRVLTEHTAGNRLEVERLAAWILRNAKNLCVDVFPETTTILQHVLGSKLQQDALIAP